MDHKHIMAGHLSVMSAMIRNLKLDKLVMAILACKQFQ